jgi:hypothetical protein
MSCNGLFNSQYTGISTPRFYLFTVVSLMSADYLDDCQIEHASIITVIAAVIELVTHAV